MEIKNDVIYFGELEVTLAIESKDGKKRRLQTDHIQMCNDLQVLRSIGHDVKASVSRSCIHQEKNKDAEECTKYLNEVSEHFDQHFKRKAA